MELWILNLTEQAEIPAHRTDLYMYNACITQYIQYIKQKQMNRQSR